MPSTPKQGPSSRPTAPPLLGDDISLRSSSAAAMNMSSTTSLRNRSGSKSRLRSSKSIAMPNPSGSTTTPNRPSMKRMGSMSVAHTPKLIYSVDDDVNDYVDEEMDKVTEEPPIVKNQSDRDYLEGYNDALKALMQRKLKSPSVQPRSTPKPEAEINEDVQKIEETIAQDLLHAEENIRMLEEIDVSSRRTSAVDSLVDGVNDDTVAGDLTSEIQECSEQQQQQDEELDNDDVSSIDSVESLNLRERQDAINSTHPFGIKIWKPSLYKKKRSVAARAEEDIHDFDPLRKPARIYWGVIVTNYLWSLTAGLLIYIICLIGATFVFIFSGFAVQQKSRPYVKLFLKLGRFWLYPFGKFVLLNKDENYIDEDQIFGRTINEFHQWRLQEEGRLFFAPPRRNTNTNGGGESRPLIKDHKGRPLRDAYSSLEEGGNSQAHALTEEEDNDEEQDDNIKMRFFGRGRWSPGRLAFYVFFYGILQPISYFIGLLCWLIVFTIPMANITGTINDHLRRHPLALDFELEKEYYKRMEDPGQKKKKQQQQQRILLCTYRCCGFHYYKYTIDGTNIFFINLLAVVIFVIFDFFVLYEVFHIEAWFTDQTVIFCGCLFSIIPLAYFIGQAVASISAQSSMGVGAAINAFFSTVVEIFLYCVALSQSKGKLVEGSMIGSILGGVLLLPGLSMCGGALKRKTQRYNPRSAGVSSTMLLYAMVIMFAPSLFYQIYGAYEIKCHKCDVTFGEDDCTKCRFIQPSFTLDTLYYKVLKPFSLIVAIALFVAYVCGLLFTLRTHASLIWATHENNTTTTNTKRHDDGSFLRSPSLVSMFDMTPKAQPTPKATPSIPKMSTLPPSALLSQRPLLATAISETSIKPTNQREAVTKIEQEQQQQHMEEVHGPGGHDAPNWSRTKSTIILLGATLLYAIIAEILVDTVDSILVDFPINPKFLGLTVFALVPNTTEFLNAISFAISGNVALSMEIGSAYALQVVLIQIPCLVVYSMVKNFVNVDQVFPLVFPRWDIIATLISIYLFTYIYAEGKSNYFKGVILILIYFVVLIGFWFNDIIEDLNDEYSGLAKILKVSIHGF
ncbi:Low affinity vacuolar monovalent cation/H [Spathaspora sp. JA1]|nr:Low affinity vacuolar monovalent cation/H [Spathaspora sp. JA1]